MGPCHQPRTGCSGRSLKCLFTAMAGLWWNSLVPSGVLPGILFSCQAAKPLWLMFLAACMGSSTYLGVGEKQGICHPNQCFNRCLTFWIGGAWIALPPCNGLWSLTTQEAILFIVLLWSALSSESILWG